MSYNAKGLWDVLCAHPRRRRLLAMVRERFPIGPLTDFPQWHLPADVLRELTGAQRWKELFTFAFVRNPWDLVVSAYHFERRYVELPQVAQREPDRAEIVRRATTFAKFVTLYPLMEAPDMTSMIAGADGVPIVDFVGRFENLREDFGQVARRIGLSGALPHENRSDDRLDYRSYYTPKTREVVRRYFVRDVERFGYRF